MLPFFVTAPVQPADPSLRTLRDRGLPGISGYSGCRFSETRPHDVRFWLIRSRSVWHRLPAAVACRESGRSSGSDRFDASKRRSSPLPCPARSHAGSAPLISAPHPGRLPRTKNDTSRLGGKGGPCLIGREDPVVHEVISMTCRLTCRNLSVIPYMQV